MKVKKRWVILMTAMTLIALAGIFVGEPTFECDWSVLLPSRPLPVMSPLVRASSLPSSLPLSVTLPSIGVHTPALMMPLMCSPPLPPHSRVSFHHCL